MMRWKPLAFGLPLGAMLWALLLLALLGCHIEASGAIVPSSPPDGLPQDAPNLYNPEVVNSYTRVSKRPYPGYPSQVTVLTSNHAYAQTESGQREPLLLIIGYLTDLRNQRIVIIVETFVHLTGAQLRSIRYWTDTGWLAGRRGTGAWDDSHATISPPMTRDEARTYLQPLYESIQAAHKRQGREAKQ